MNAMRLLFIINITVLISFQSNCVDIGSDTAVTRFTAQQTLNEGDRIAGFSALEAGFDFSGTNTTATFDSFFHVTGDINHGGATLILNRDLVLQNLSSFKFLGNIVGNHHVLELSPSHSCLPSATDIELCCKAFLVTTTILPIGNCEVLGWSFDDRFIAGGGDDFAGGNHELYLYELTTDKNLIFRDSDVLGAAGATASEANDIRWHPSKHLFVYAKQLGSTDDEVIVFSVDSGTGVLTQVSSDAYAADAKAAAWHPSGDYIAIGLEDNANEIVIYPVSGTGVLDIAGSFDFDIISNQDTQEESLDWDTTGSYLAIGLNTNASDPEVLVYEFNDAPSLSLTLNSSIPSSGSGGSSVTKLDWNKTCTDLLAVGFTDNTVVVYRHNAVAGTLTTIDTLAFDADIDGISWSPGGNCLAVGRDNVGGAGAFQTYHFDKEVEAFSSVISNFEFLPGDKDVEGVRWSPGGKLIAVGNDNALLSVYTVLKGCCFTWSDINVVINCDVTLKDCCLIFSGESSINGRGNCLSLSSSCTVIVDRDSTFLFKDITVKGVRDTNIQMLDSSTTISLDQVEWVLDEDYTFTEGHFDVVRKFQVVGDGYSFIYQTDMQSTIGECGIFFLDKGVTFSYDPRVASNTLLALLENSSKLFLRGATLHATQTGLQLTKGILQLDDSVLFSSEATTEAQGIILGDGISAGNDLCVKWLAESGFNATQGFVVYKNVDNS